MISKVIVADGLIEVYDKNDLKLSSITVANKEIAAVAENFYVVYHNNAIEVYNAESKMLSTMIREGKVVTGTIANTITIKNDLFIESYDENCNFKHTNNAVSAINKITKQELEAMKTSLLVEQERFQNLKNIMCRHGQYESLIPIKNIETNLRNVLEMIENTIK